MAIIIRFIIEIGIVVVIGVVVVIEGRIVEGGNVVRIEIEGVPSFYWLPAILFVTSLA